MATGILLRTLRRRDVAEAPLSAYKYLAGNAKTSDLGYRWVGLIRQFSSKPAGNDITGIDLCTTDSSVAFMESKNPIKNPEGACTIPSVVGFKPKGELLIGEHMSKGGFVRSGNLINNRQNIFRPLSPHLPVYQPQLSSTLSISHRISASFLSAIVLSSYFLCLKVGLICFTYENFYQFLFYSSKLIPISLEITALALSYHLYHGVRHLFSDFSGKMGFGYLGVVCAMICIAIPGFLLSAIYSTSLGGGDQAPAGEY